ncbi:MAG: ECF-type sigma factor [Planctomycetota bacterium]
MMPFSRAMVTPTLHFAGTFGRFEKGRGDWMDDSQWLELVHGVRDGDSRSCHDFWNRFGPMIERVAKHRLSPAMQRRVGPESISLSVCRSFFRRAQEGKFELEDEDAVWRLLCAITVNKTRMKARFHLNQKRGLQVESRPENFESQFPDSQPDPADEVEFSDQLEVLMQSFNREEASVLEMKLQRYTHEEIAKKLDVSERTVRRMNKRIQARLSFLLNENPGSH